MMRTGRAGHSASAAAPKHKPTSAAATRAASLTFSSAIRASDVRPVAAAESVIPEPGEIPWHQIVATGIRRAPVDAEDEQYDPHAAERRADAGLLRRRLLAQRHHLRPRCRARAPRAGDLCG